MLEFKLTSSVKIYIVEQEIPLPNTADNIVHPPVLEFGPLHLKLGNQRQTYQGTTRKSIQGNVQTQAV